MKNRKQSRETHNGSAVTSSTRRGKRARKIRYAVVGLGYIAQNAVLPAFENTGNSELAALVSGSPQKLRELGSNYDISALYSYDEFEECLVQNDIDVAYIAVPNGLHHEFTVRAIDVGVNVLCEKPLCTSVAGGIAMARCAEEARVKLMTAYRLHFDKANLEVVRLVKEGAIGEARIFNSVFSYQIAPNNARLSEELGGGSLFDLGVYAINAARYIFRDEPRWVAAQLIKNEDPRFSEVDGSCAALLLFPDNRIAQFTSSFAAADSAYFEVIGTKGKIRLENAYEYSEGATLIKEIDGKSTRREFSRHDQFAAELSYFSDCILKKKEPEPSAEEGIADLRIIEAIHESSERGEFVEIYSNNIFERPDPHQAIEKRPIRKSFSLVGVQGPHLAEL